LTVCFAAYLKTEVKDRRSPAQTVKAPLTYLQHMAKFFIDGGAGGSSV
jgi:hypothetical protein